MEHRNPRHPRQIPSHLNEIAGLCFTISQSVPSRLPTYWIVNSVLWKGESGVQMRLRTTGLNTILHLSLQQQDLPLLWMYENDRTQTRGPHSGKHHPDNTWSSHLKINNQTWCWAQTICIREGTKKDCPPETTISWHCIHVLTTAISWQCLCNLIRATKCKGAWPWEPQ